MRRKSTKELIAGGKAVVFKDTEKLTFPEDFVWKCWTPEYRIEMQFKTHAEALKVGVMRSDERKWMIEKDFMESDGGW